MDVDAIIDTCHHTWLSAGVLRKNKMHWLMNKISMEHLSSNSISLRFFWKINFYFYFKSYGCIKISNEKSVNQLGTGGSHL
jgi:hypothetical protein